MTSTLVAQEFVSLVGPRTSRSPGPLLSNYPRTPSRLGRIRLSSSNRALIRLRVTKHLNSRPPNEHERRVDRESRRRCPLL